MASDSTQTVKMSVSLPRAVVDALNGMLRDDENETFSGLLTKLVEPAAEHWYETGRRIGRDDLKRDVNRARLKKAEAVSRLALAEAAALRKELGEDDAPNAAPSQAPRMTIMEFLKQTSHRQPDALLPHPPAACLTQFRVNAVRAGLDPDEVIAKIPEYRRETARAWEAESQARREQRERVHAGAVR